jgi:phage terminase small subunit
MTPKQLAFCEYYLECLNATQAATKAGYSKKTAFRIGAENMQKPAIKKYIDERLSKLNKQKIADVNETLEFISNMMRNEKANNKDRLKAADMMMQRYKLMDNSLSDNKLEVIIKKASEVIIKEDDDNE